MQRFNLNLTLDSLIKEEPKHYYIIYEKQIHFHHWNNIFLLFYGIVQLFDFRYLERNSIRETGD